MSFFLTVGACRLRVLSKLPRRFATPADAEQHYFHKSAGESTEGRTSKCIISQVDRATQTSTVFGENTSTQTDEQKESMCDVLQQFVELCPTDREKIIGEQLSLLAGDFGVHLSPDFVKLSIQASKHLSVWSF